MSDVLLCGVREALGDGSPSLKLGSNRPLVLIQDALPSHGRDEIWSWLEEAHNRWGKVCDWKAERIMDITDLGPNDYVQLVTVADLGTQGVLADQMLPYTGGRILKMRINYRVNWKRTDGPMPQGTVDPVRTLTHETGHFMGMQHYPTSPPKDLMEPYILQDIIGPQTAEGKMAAGWFGEPTVVPPPPPPGPTGVLIPASGLYTATVTANGILLQLPKP